MEQQWHELEADKVLDELSTNWSTGLDHGAVAERTQEHGRNEFTSAKRDSVVSMVIHQFRDVANVILLVAVGLSLALAIREGHGYLEPLVIFAVIAMNIALAVSQERSAERALEALQTLTSPTCFVLRDGSRVEIDTAQVVPGDILLLKTGDLVAADARLIESTDFFVDESSLTGESEPSEKDATSFAEPEAPIGDMANMVFSGCLVTSGNASAVVVATGMATQMGKTAAYLNNAQKLQTPLQKRLNRVSRTISVIAIGAAVVLLAVGIHQGEDFWVMMLAAVSLAVAAVPETLQLIVTLSLTQGVKNMVSRHALVRKLPAVETLGNTSVICSDKTGTLTQNRMTIQRLWTPDGDDVDAAATLTVEQTRLLRYLSLASNASIEKTPEGDERIIGDATESAILRLLADKGDDRSSLMEVYPRVAEIPFSSSRKMMTTIHTSPDGGYLVLTKGAFDRLRFREASPEEVSSRRAMHDQFALGALRVIALGMRHIDNLPTDGDFGGLEDDLTFVGIIGLIDPPRPEAAEAIAVAKRAGVRTVMITGDHAATAGAIAKQIGLMGDDGTVVTGRQLAKMSDEELVDNVRDYSVYARVSPEDKIRIVEAWQEQGEVVSMTGDGVNDAPALKAADVGVAMGQSGTEVAKSAADIVLTDDNFATIVSAVREGRTVFANIRKTIYFLLVCNLSEIIIMIGVQVMGWGIALTPVMLLLINVLGDGIPGLHLAREQSSERIMHRKPIGRDESFFGGGLARLIAQQTIAFAVVGVIAYYVGAFLVLPSGSVPSQVVGQTMAFLVIAFTSILHIFTVRTNKSVFRHTVRDNMPMVYSVVAMIAIFALMALIGPVGAIFGLVPIAGMNWLVVIGLTAVPTIVAEVAKLLGNRNETHEFSKRLVHHEALEAQYA